MIVLYTDFGTAGPYTGQVKAVLGRLAPAVDVIDLFADAPAHDVKASAYLLPAFVNEFPAGTVFLCVVDPGVGGPRVPGVLWADGRWYVGPVNGLFELIVRRAVEKPRWWEITWRPERLSATFHGRDLFAPVVARLALGHPPAGIERPVDDIRQLDWPDDLSQVIYIDGFGNAMTGLRASGVSAKARIVVKGTEIDHARIFSDVSMGEAFWYENANGLAEIAVNRGNAAGSLELTVGTEVIIT
jgi:S-adenosylmethionine hydrolase